VNEPGSSSRGNKSQSRGTDTKVYKHNVSCPPMWRKNLDGQKPIRLSNTFWSDSRNRIDVGGIKGRKCCSEGRNHLDTRVGLRRLREGEDGSAPRSTESRSELGAKRRPVESYARGNLLRQTLPTFWRHREGVAETRTDPAENGHQKAATTEGCLNFAKPIRQRGNL